MGVQVLRGPELDLPQNKLITQIRFFPKEADLKKIKEQWDVIAKILPKKDGPPGICDRAEEFREEYAPNHASLEQDRKAYFDRIRKEAEQVKAKLSSFKRQGKALVVVDVPLLFEAKWQNRFDSVIFVKAPKKKCIQRLLFSVYSHRVHPRRLLNRSHRH